MKRRRPSSGIGLSMLDLISNAVAATFILFIVLNAIRLPPIPPERIEGFLLIRYEIISQNSIGEAQTRIWVEIPDSNKFQNVLPSDRFSTYWYPPLSQDNSLEDATTSMIVFSPEDSLNVIYLLCENPYGSIWKTGLLFADHEQLNSGKQQGEAKIQIQFLSSNGDEKIWTDTIKSMEAPTVWLPKDFKMK